MPGARESFGDKIKDFVERHSILKKLKDLIKKSIPYVQKGASAIGTAAAGIGVRVLGGKEAYNNLVDRSEIQKANREIVGSKVVYNEDEFHLEGTVKSMEQDKNGTRYTVDLVNGKTVTIDEKDLVTKHEFERQNSKLPAEYKMKLIDAELWNEIQKEKNQQDKNQEQSDDKKGPEQENMKQDKSEEEPVKNQEIADEEKETQFESDFNQDEQEEEMFVASEEPIPDDFDEEFVDDDIEEEISEQHDEIEQDESAAKEDIQQPEEQEVYYFPEEPNVVILTEADLEEERRREQEGMEKFKKQIEELNVDHYYRDSDEVVPQQAEFDIPSTSNKDLQASNHVLYSYKGKFQEAEITAVHNKSIDLKLNNGKTCNVKKADIDKALFGFEDIKNNKVMNQCVTDPNNTKFSDMFRQVYQEKTDKSLEVKQPEADVDANSLDTLDELDDVFEFENSSEPMSIKDLMNEAKEETSKPYANSLDARNNHDDISLDF